MDKVSRYLRQIQSSRPCQQTECCMRRRVVVELGDLLPDLIAALPGPEQGQPGHELIRQLCVGEWVLVVAGRICDSRDEAGSIVEGDGHAVGDASRVAGSELRIFNNRGA